MAIMARNRINVNVGEPAFAIGSNLCDYFEIGSADGADYWIRGSIIDDGEFLFNARLFLPDQSDHGTIIDSFPKGPTPKGWTKRQRADGKGYDLVADDGTILFGYRVDDYICIVTVNIYAADGSIVAECDSEELKIIKPPATIGRNGIRFG